MWNSFSCFENKMSLHLLFKRTTIMTKRRKGGTSIWQGRSTTLISRWLVQMIGRNATFSRGFHFSHGKPGLEPRKGKKRRKKSENGVICGVLGIRFPFCDAPLFSRFQSPLGPSNLGKRRKYFLFKVLQQFPMRLFRWVRPSGPSATIDSVECDLYEIKKKRV
ncbi:hypothetical protein BDB00DRAFT_482764 [Zychaea mexicana]|uniref:uncharacterized protein n=1 Tax=Zychaea mexicana TaxID=64656 RepID=UPI0022FF3C2B|nr:uncharacterized protein BDB00DRAFT_482764 [Zychaea mexicana]KAI9491633.1 hypothetical protein BDB00DRAFT_482764 [Zychaea mexicana]